MDNLTHSLFALTLARTPLSRAGQGTTAALLIASNAPDIDIVTAAGGGASYLTWHRGPSHGPLAVIGLGVLVAAIVWSVRWIRDRRSPPSPEGPAASFMALVGIAVLGVVCHILMDLPTSYGTRLLSPFDWHWFTTDWMPIIDVYLLVILGSGLIAQMRPGVPRRSGAALVLLLVVANYAVRAVAHDRALIFAHRAFGSTLPAPCDTQPAKGSPLARWPRVATRHSQNSRESRAAGHRCLIDLAAIPTFASPFQWRIIAQLSNAYEIHDIDVFGSELRASEIREDDRGETRTTLSFPNQWNESVIAAAETRLGRVFLGFSRFPAARSFVNGKTGETIVRWTDMRFVIEPIATDQPTGRAEPFTATVRFDRNGRVIEQRLGP